MQSIVSLSALLVASMILVLGNGVASLLIPTRAALEGWSTDVIALIGASYALAFTIGCIVIPRIVARVGHIRTFGFLGTLTTISMLLHAMEPQPWVWVLVRTMAGFSIAGSYMVLEAWLNEEATNENRGFVFSIYMVLSLAGMAIGPFLVTLGNPRDFELFAWAAIIYAVATLPIALTGRSSPQPLARVSLNLRALYRNSPAAAVGSLVTGIVAGSFGSLVPVYGAGIGFDVATVATLIAAATFGSMLFQLPIGRLSDRIDRRWVMVVVGGAGAILAVAVAVTPTVIPASLPELRISTAASDPIVVSILMLLFGGSLYTTYSLNVAHANDWARDVSFVTVASGLLILYGIGSTLGPLVAARVMAFMGPEGLFVFIAVAQTAYAAFALYRITQRGDVAIDDQTDFQPLPIAPGSTPQTFELDQRADEEGGDDWHEPDPVEYGVSGEA